MLLNYFGYFWVCFQWASCPDRLNTAPQNIRHNASLVLMSLLFRIAPIFFPLIIDANSALVGFCQSPTIRDFRY